MLGRSTSRIVIQGKTRTYVRSPSASSSRFYTAASSCPRFCGWVRVMNGKTIIIVQEWCFFCFCFFFKLDICCLFGWEFGKCFNLLRWLDLEEIIRWSWQPAFRARNSDTKEGALHGESRCPLCHKSSGLGVLSRTSAPWVLKFSL